jgi:hypothetical protein
MYRNAMISAADWLVQTQDPDGCWRRGHAQFARQGVKAYETHVAWGLFEAARVEPGRGYGEAAIRNLQWALSLQNAEGWFEDCCSRALIHPGAQSSTGAYYQSVGTPPEGLKLGASPFLISQVAGILRQEGVQIFNLGGAGEDNPGL